MDEETVQKILALLGSAREAAHEIMLENDALKKIVRTIDYYGAHTQDCIDHHTFTECICGFSDVIAWCQENPRP